MNESMNNVEKIFMVLAFVVAVAVLVVATEAFAQSTPQRDSSKVESTSQKEADSVAQADMSMESWQRTDEEPERYVPNVP